jgi:hypothetical protein
MVLYPVLADILKTQIRVIIPIVFFTYLFLNVTSLYCVKIWDKVFYIIFFGDGLLAVISFVLILLLTVLMFKHKEEGYYAFLVYPSLVAIFFFGIISTSVDILIISRR